MSGLVATPSRRHHQLAAMVAKNETYLPTTALIRLYRPTCEIRDQCRKVDEREALTSPRSTHFQLARRLLRSRRQN